MSFSISDLRTVNLFLFYFSLLLFSFPYFFISIFYFGLSYEKRSDITYNYYSYYNNIIKYNICYRFLTHVIVTVTTSCDIEKSIDIRVEDNRLGLFYFLSHFHLFSYFELRVRVIVWHYMWLSQMSHIMTRHNICYKFVIYVTVT